MSKLLTTKLQHDRHKHKYLEFNITISRRHDRCYYWVLTHKCRATLVIWTGRERNLLLCFYICIYLSILKEKHMCSKMHACLVSVGVCQSGGGVASYRSYNGLGPSHVLIIYVIKRGSNQLVFLWYLFPYKSLSRTSFVIMTTFVVLYHVFDDITTIKTDCVRSCSLFDSNLHLLFSLKRYV